MKELLNQLFYNQNRFTIWLDDKENFYDVNNKDCIFECATDIYVMVKYLASSTVFGNTWRMVAIPYKEIRTVTWEEVEECKSPMPIQVESPPFDDDIPF